MDPLADVPDVTDILDLDPASILIRHLLGRVMKPAIDFGGRATKAHWNLRKQMPQVDRAWNNVRSELADVGLLYPPAGENDGGYLDQIEVQIAWLPSLGEYGYVYEGVDWFTHLIGYEEGVIYLPADLPRKAYVPGETLADVIRHEYAHAWHWLEPEFFERPWFQRAFGGDYEEGEIAPQHLFEQKLIRSHKSKIEQCRNDRERLAYVRRLFNQDFVSEYAATLFCEDFAETFMVYLRHRKNLSRYKNRPGVFKKLLAVEKAVKVASKELGI
jgi:hypothetical protein